MQRKGGTKKGPIAVKFESLTTQQQGACMNFKIVPSISKVFIGIDVHKRTYKIAVWIEGQVIKTFTLPAEPKRLLVSLRSQFPNASIISAYEAGFCGFGLHRFLIENGIQNIVVNPASIEVAANDKKKTDRRDAKKIAEQLAAGRLKCIYIPSRKEELARQISRTREQVKKEQRRAANRIKSKLLQFGFLSDLDRRKVSRKFLNWVESLELERELRFAIGLLIAQWRFLSKQLDDLKIEFQAQAFENAEVEEIYQSVPGVGPISARVLNNELGDLGNRFKNVKALYQYTGLTPSEHSSGDKVYKGSIDRQGPSRVRHILVEVTWRAIEKDPYLRECFNSISIRAGKKKAIIAIARKLIGRIRACFIGRCPYEIGLVA
jgi:transposase